ncbi:MAG TPA: bifunctional phosphoribosyl-AMP cyclohydrolase/phosphoribosyl-ATP diphosphatase HisIE [Candidatus Adamsella sp.]|nr:bifunctional phosphoribosyl-AMP cyclohydrolase/phosphoribosyl-ATP diphosphatase HisIE [Candidatus Adamsella sp.]
MIIPSIDIMGGKAVQLKQGKEKVLEREDIFELAKYFSRFGELAVIDLDAAMGKGDNEELIKKICRIAPCRVGGGIRDVEKAKRIIANGAKKIIIGTAASEELLSQLPKDKILVAIDSNKGKVVTEGWTKDTGITPEDYVKRFDDLCHGYLYTIVEKEGMMGGTDLEAIKKIRKLTKKELVAAGGISSIDEIKELEKNNISSQLGMCIYTNAVKLEDAFCAMLDFEKQNNLIPTIVQDARTKQVLMLAYSNKEAVMKTLKDGLATYFSRSRNELWTKGLTSGNTQELVSARYDCDRDTLLYKVNQKGVACHLGRYSCFEDKDFDIHDLVEVLEQRKRELPEKSFTTKLFKNDFYLKRKIMEEAFEVVNFEEGDGLEWEAADLAYFVLTFMVKNNISVEDVLSNLASRRK